MKVLVVDDSRSDRKIIRYNLEWHGCEVLEAGNGKQGLELAAQYKPDLIVSDCLMPVMDGFQLLHELRKVTELKGVPLIFYSAVYTGSKEAELALSLGAQAFIEKPKSPDQFWEEIGRVLAACQAGEGRGELKEWQEDEFLRHYSEMVAAKLEEKVRELTAANESLLRLNTELEQRVIDRTGQLEAVGRELELLCFAVSHDLRAPLRHLDGFARALVEDYGGKLNTNGRDYLERIRKASRRLLEMIDALVELSRFAQGKVTRESVDLSAMAREIAGELGHSQPERNVVFRIAEGLMVRGDPRLLRVALGHLLGNAWKFTAGRQDALVEFYPKEVEGRLAFVVSDNGIGFDMAYADRLFAPFQRLHPNREFEGKGVGLAIVKRIINRHGGWIKVEAEPDLGATFTFTV